MSTTDSVLPTPPPSPVPKRHPLALLLGTIINPRDTFIYLRERGGWSWFLPLALALALTLTARAVAIPIERAQMEAALAKLQAQLGDQNPGQDGPGSNQGGPGLVIQGGPARAGGPVTSASNWLFDYGLPLGAVIFDWGLRGLALSALAWLAGGRPSFGAMFRLSSWALVPSLARLLVMLAVMLVMGRIPATGLQPASPAVDVNATTPGGDTFLVGPAGAVMNEGPQFSTLLWQNFLSTLDIYRLWELALLVVGVLVMARVSWLKALIPPLGYWGLSLVLTTLPALFMPWLMSLFFGAPMLGP
jgi:hypothetical protein